MKITIYTDGGARGNPGPAAVGVVIYQEGKKEPKKYSKFLGEMTNNQAEYEAVLYAMELAKKIKPRPDEIDFYLDSELLVGQLNRQFKIKNKELGKYFIKIWNSSQSFNKINYHYIPRQKNREADELVNQAIDEVTK